MEKLDLKKELKYLYLPSAKKIELVDVPAMNFVMIDGAIEAGPGPRHLAALRGEHAGALQCGLYAQVRRQAAQAGPDRLPGDGARRAVVGGRRFVRYPQARQLEIHRDDHAAGPGHAGDVRRGD